MKIIWLIFSMMIFSFSARAKIKNKFDHNFFHGVQLAPHDGEDLTLKDVSAELIAKIEKNHKAIAKDKETFLKSKNIIVMDLPDDSGPSYIILYFADQGKLKAAISESGKYSSCRNFQMKKTMLRYTCTGTERGQIWNNKILYDFKKMKISVKNG